MGLDMYFYRKRYVKNWNHNETKNRVTLTVDGVDVPLIDVAYIVEQVGYWRKSNHIHQWFVANVQDGVDECQEAHVEKAQIKALRDTCLAVLEHHELAPKLLPTTSGFFFGGTEYSDWYFEDLEATVQILEPLLDNDDDYTVDYYYQSSW